MPTIHAIYEHGVFRPTEPVDLDEATEVVFEPRVIDPNSIPPAIGTEPLSDRRLTDGEIRRWLDDLAACSSGASLPADWSRADIYDEDEPR